MRLRQYAGLSILLVVSVIVALYMVLPDPATPGATEPVDDITVKGIIGGKIAFFQDPSVIEILKEKYGLTVEYKRVPSIDMVEECVDGLDYCWPSSQIAGELIGQKFAPVSLRSEIIFNSPITFYTWAPIADALIAQGIVVKEGDVYYLDDLPKLVQWISEGKQWSEIGVPQLYGTVSIISTEPTRSNTGNSWAALLANTLNDGQVVNNATVDGIAPQLHPFFNRLSQNTSTQLFEAFMTQGMGAYPICVLYESNLLEYVQANPSESVLQEVRDEVRTLYPRPTVWSSQPMLALTPGGERLITALRDPEIQALGWSHHGFRTGVPIVQNDVAMIPVTGLPADIDSVISMPRPDVMDQIIATLSNETVQTSPGTPAAAYRRDDTS
jgi:hypothetical protein